MKLKEHIEKFDESLLEEKKLDKIFSHKNNVLLKDHIEKYDESDPNPALHTGFKIEYLDYGNLGVVKATVNNSILQSAVFEPCSLPNTSVSGIATS